jgi:hypothetical protein
MFKRDRKKAHEVSTVLVDAWFDLKTDLTRIEKKYSKKEKAARKARAKKRQAKYEAKMSSKWADLPPDEDWEDEIDQDLAADAIRYSMLPLDEI